MGKQSEYWRAREKAALEQNEKREKSDYDRQLAEIYQQMMDDCDADIQKFYARYAKKEGITLAEAKKRADKLDIEAYGRKAERYVRDKDFSKEANEEMRLYNMTMKANRLELLKSELSLEMTAGSDGFQKMMARILPERTKDSYERQAGVLGMSIPDAETYGSMVDSIVNGSFHNATWSQRVWANQEALRSQVNTLLVRGLIGGKNPRVLARDLAKSVGAGLKNAERLMRTELARVQIGAQEQAISDAGYSSYKFLAVGSACEDCQALDGKTFKLDKMVPGENAPPMHPNCRCSVCAAMSDEEFKELTGVDPAELDLNEINQAVVERYETGSNKIQARKKKSYEKRTRKNIDSSSLREHNNSPTEDELRKQYRKDVDDGWITPLFSESQYLKLYHDLQEQVVGLKTTNGIEVTDTSAHFMARMIGTSRDPKIYANKHKIVRRSGVEMEDVIDAIENGKEHKRQHTAGKGESITFYGQNASVTLNLSSGLLVQCNPI